MSPRAERMRARLAGVAAAVDALAEVLYVEALEIYPDTRHLGDCAGQGRQALLGAAALLRQHLAAEEGRSPPR